MSAAAGNQWETRFVDVQSQAEISLDGKRIHGTAIVFNQLSDPMSTPSGEFRERIRPSAVDRTIREGVDVRAYFNHNLSQILGRLTAGTLQQRKERDGLRIQITPPDTTYARDLMKSIKRGDISGMSFRFRIVPPHGQDFNFEDGIIVRDITDMIYREVSVVTEPAYPQTDVAVRSFQEFHDDQIQYRPSADWQLRRLRARL
jgi:Escherichia/Staphylococcus phage prohead protease